MWNVELKTLHDFKGLGRWVQFPQIALLPQIPYNGLNLNLKWSLHLSKVPLDVKWLVEDF